MPFLSLISPSILAETITLSAESPLITNDLLPLSFQMSFSKNALVSTKLSSYLLFISIWANDINNSPSIILFINSVLGFSTEDKTVLDNNPEDKNGSMHNDFPINSNIMLTSSPEPPRPPNFGEIKPLITPKFELSFQKSLEKPSFISRYSLLLFISL